jgi:hypothetical protein
MTDVTQPEPDGPTATDAKAADTKDDTAPAPTRVSGWRALNRTNRIAALILGGVAAVILAALIFGAGLMVGTEFGDSEDHHGRSDTSDYRDGGDDAPGEHEGDAGDDADRESQHDGEHGDQGDSDQQSQSERPPVPATPKP